MSKHQLCRRLLDHWTEPLDAGRQIVVSEDDFGTEDLFCRLSLVRHDAAVHRAISEQGCIEPEDCDQRCDAALASLEHQVPVP